MKKWQVRLIRRILKAISLGSLLFDLSDCPDDPTQFNKTVQKHRGSDQAVPKKTGVAGTEETIEGFPLYLLASPSGNQQKVVLYLHGGAYVTGPSSVHWGFVDELARQTPYDVAVFNYPKAPEYQAETTVAMTMLAFQQLLERYGAANLIVMGDSAGGGLALSVVMAHLAEAGAAPQRLILFSPWVDVSMSHPEAAEYQDLDLMLNIEGLTCCGQVYAGQLGVNHPWVSPKYGALAGLPPLDIFVGGAEVFYPDCRDFVIAAQQAGVDARLTVGPDMPHVYPILPGIPASRRAATQVIATLNS